MSRFIQQLGFVFRFRYFPKFSGGLRRMWLTFFGMKIGANTNVPKMRVTWPHQVSIGKNCVLEKNIQYKFDGIWQSGPSIIISDNVFIGADCEFNIRKGIVIRENSNIASGCRFVDHDHGKSIQGPIGPQPGVEGEISIGFDVWLGCNVIILKGVNIGDGVIVGAGAVVTKSIPSNEIWAGVPAKKIGDRSE